MEGEASTGFTGDHLIAKLRTVVFMYGCENEVGDAQGQKQPWVLSFVRGISTGAL